MKSHKVNIHMNANKQYFPLVNWAIRKVMGGGGRGIFEPQEFFLLSNPLYEFFLGHCMNIF